MKYTLLLALLFSVSSAFLSDEPADMKTVEIPTSTVNVTAVCPDNSCNKMDTMNSKINSMDTKINKMQSNMKPLDASESEEPEEVLSAGKRIIIGVVGQGVAPMNTTSPAQAYALAKRAAVADAYRMIAEKVKGVRVDGQDLIKNMMVQRSTVRTSVDAMVKNANIVETTFKEGLCEVEMEIELSHSQFAQ